MWRSPEPEFKLFRAFQPSNFSVTSREKDVACLNISKLLSISRFSERNDHADGQCLPCWRNRQRCTYVLIATDQIHLRAYSENFNRPMKEPCHRAKRHDVSCTERGHFWQINVGPLQVLSIFPLALELGTDCEFLSQDLTLHHSKLVCHHSAQHRFVIWPIIEIVKE
jgi:hypothetical protein